MANIVYERLAHGKISTRELNEHLNKELDITVKYIFSSVEPPSDMKDGMLWYNPRTRCAKICYLGTFRDIVLPAPDRDRKTVVFILGGHIEAGVQPKYISFPYDGIIRRARACCVTPSSNGIIEIAIEKTSRENLKDDIWDPITARHLEIGVGELTDDNLSTLAIEDITKGEYLRVNILNTQSDIKNITVELDIEIGI